MITQTLADRVLVDPFKAVADFYAGCLAGNEKATHYVRETMGFDEQQATQLGIGFVDRSLGTKLPHSRIKQGNEVRQLLMQVGLYKPNGRETLRGYVTEPIRDAELKIIGIKGYKLDPKAKGPETMEITQAGESQVNASPTDPSTSPACGRGRAPARVRAFEKLEEGSLKREGQHLLFTRDDRTYRIRGLEKNNNLLQLKVNLMVSRQSLCHLDVFDLTKASARRSFIKAAAIELYVDADTIKQDISLLLIELETFQSERIRKLKEPAAKLASLTDDQTEAALSLLRDRHLIDRIAADMRTCGIVGERANGLIGYVAATSRKLDSPLAVVIQSSSSAGKTSLMDAVLAMMPPEDVQRYSGLSGQSLYYLESEKIRHKILAISEDEGIGRAAYALKLLQSEKQLRHAVVARGEDGRAQTQDHHVEGPVQIFLTTTALEVDEELANRCLVLSVDETSQQTAAIQAAQRKSFTAEFTKTGYQAQQLRQLHQNAQRLLRPLQIFNPYAPQLAFPSHKTRMRRDQLKYLTLINAIAFLHQHQRESYTIETLTGPVQAIDVTLEDIRNANRLAGEALGRSLDELAPQTRLLLERLDQFVEEQAGQRDVPRDAVRFSRRDVRSASGLSHSQLSVQLTRLVEMEYLHVHRGRNGRSYVYELLYRHQASEGLPILTGLIDPAKLTESTLMTPTFRS
jgi:hypothetical protein